MLSNLYETNVVKYAQAHLGVQAVLEHIPNTCNTIVTDTNGWI